MSAPTIPYRCKEGCSYEMLHRWLRADPHQLLPTAVRWAMLRAAVEDVQRCTHWSLTMVWAEIIRDDYGAAVRRFERMLDRYPLSHFKPMQTRRRRKVAAPAHAGTTTPPESASDAENSPENAATARTLTFPTHTSRNTERKRSPMSDIEMPTLTCPACFATFRDWPDEEAQYYRSEAVRVPVSRALRCPECRPTTTERK